MFDLRQPNAPLRRQECAGTLRHRGSETGIMRKTRVIIAGAGLGGLAAAASLLEKGFDVQVFEQAPLLGEVGAGIQQSANAVRVLYDLGLRDELEKVAVRPRAY